MSRYNYVMLFVPLMYGVLFFLYFIRIYQTEYVEFEQFVLEKQVNYAADSAIDEMILSAYLSQDYNNGAYQTYEPDVAVNDYAATLCYDFGLIPTESNVQYVLDTRVRTMVVCAFDGFYVFKRQKNETHSYQLTQSPKIPYFYTDKTGRQFCLTLDPDLGFWDSGNEGTYKVHQLDKYPASIRPSNDQQATAINNAISDYLNNALYDTYSSGNMDTIVELPALGSTVRGDQPVSSPTVIGVVDGIRKVFSTVVTAESIGGAQVEETTYNIGYTLHNATINGNVYNGKFYATTEWWDKHSNVLNFAVESQGRYFDSVFDAACEGYKNLNLLE